MGATEGKEEEDIEYVPTGAPMLGGTKQDG